MYQARIAPFTHKTVKRKAEGEALAPPRNRQVSRKRVDRTQTVQLDGNSRTIPSGIG